MASRIAGICLLLVSLLLGALAFWEIGQPAIDLDDVAFQNRLTIFCCVFGAAMLVSGIMLLARKRT